MEELIYVKIIIATEAHVQLPQECIHLSFINNMHGFIILRMLVSSAAFAKF